MVLTPRNSGGIAEGAKLTTAPLVHRLPFSKRLTGVSRLNAIGHPRTPNRTEPPKVATPAPGRQHLTFFGASLSAQKA